MKLFLGYESALEFWRAAGCGLAPIPEPSSIRSIDGKAVCLVKPQFRECARISFGSVHETFAGLRTDPPTLTATS